MCFLTDFSVYTCCSLQFFKRKYDLFGYCFADEKSLVARLFAFLFVFKGSIAEGLLRAVSLQQKQES